MENIIWQPLPGYESLYLISTDGKIKSTERIITDSKKRRYCLKETLMSITTDKRSGYLVVKLTKGLKYGTQYLHRLMAKTFISNPKNKPFVNHINGNKQDPRIENLEWVTPSENHLHAISIGLCRLPSKNKTKVIDICLEREFECISEAARYHQIDYGVCKKMLKGVIPNDTCLRLAV